MLYTVVCNNIPRFNSACIRMYIKIHIKSQGECQKRYFWYIQYMYGHFVRNSYKIVNEIIRGHSTYASVRLEYLLFSHSYILQFFIKTYMLTYILNGEVFLS